MHTHSVENRFIAIVCAALVLLVVPLFALFFYLSAERAMDERTRNAELIMFASAQALGKALWDHDAVNARKIADALIADDDVLSVRVTDTAGKVNITLPANAHAQPRDGQHLEQPITFSTVIGDQNVGKLEVDLVEGGLFSNANDRDISFTGIFALAIVIVFAAALIVNRVIVMRPLLRLTEAIVATRNLGSRHQVDWNSTDEMGVLASNFNEMQKELEREENQLKAAHAMVQNIYNQTPAMLYSLDRDGIITTVSDYWLLATGYQRGEVMGKPFLDFVHPSSHVAYLHRVRPGADGTSTPGITVRFVCAGNRQIDVLIRETTPGSNTGSTLSVMTDVTELKEAETRNLEQAITDHLTGLPNRQGFELELDRKIADADHNGEELACLFVDLDRFKWINDSLGHAAGDFVLREAVHRMTVHIRAVDTLARLGGDEFAILIPARDVERLAGETAAAVNGIFTDPFVLDGMTISLSASIGIALYPKHAGTASELLRKSDMAMYSRKRNGKNGLAIFCSELADRQHARAEMERDIELGLRNDWFEAWMQPIINLRTNRISAFETLLRLNHPRKGILPPYEIICAAEENGTIGDIGYVIMQKAIQNLSRISILPDLEKVRIGINISPIQINTGLPTRLSKVLLEHGIPPDRLTIEITEAVLMQDKPEVYEVLSTLSRSGVHIALDDFGSGYSSLSYLHRFPVNIVKIDKSFIQALSSRDSQVRDKSLLLIEGINTIAHQINCSVVAEGIEDDYVRDILTDMGVDMGQGYLFAKPMSVNDVERLYRTPAQKMRASM